MYFESNLYLAQVVGSVKGRLLDLSAILHFGGIVELAAYIVTKVTPTQAY